MVVALPSRDENTVLIFAGRIMSQLLNNHDNAALISSHVAGLTSPSVLFHPTPDVFLTGLT